MPCLSATFNPAIGPLLNVLIAPAGTLKVKANGGEKQRVGAYSLLIDTGADITCLTTQVAADMGLQLLGKRDVGHAAGSAKVNTYLADIAIPFGDPTKGAETHIAEKITVMEFSGVHQNYQGLLGRDLICRGLLSISGWDSRYIFCL